MSHGSCPQHGLMDAWDCLPCMKIRTECSIKPEQDHRSCPDIATAEIINVSKEEFEAYLAWKKTGGKSSVASGGKPPLA